MMAAIARRRQGLRSFSCCRCCREPILFVNAGAIRTRQTLVSPAKGLGHALEDRELVADRRFLLRLLRSAIQPAARAVRAAPAANGPAASAARAAVHAAA